jgi:hypothetical protein
MGREYECYCHTCQRHQARSDCLTSGYKLFQCLNCGACWYEVKTVRPLNTNGIDQKTWNLAMHEAYENIDNRSDENVLIQSNKNKI